LGLKIPERITEKNSEVLFRNRIKLKRRHSADSGAISMQKPNCSAPTLYPIDDKLSASHNAKMNVHNKSNYNPNNSSTKGKKFNIFCLRRFSETPFAYLQFLKNIFQCYKEITNTCGLVENICQELLNICEFSKDQDLSDYDLHKSIFSQEILRDKIIKVRQIF
jgi:hypothetical protein